MCIVISYSKSKKIKMENKMDKKLLKIQWKWMGWTTAFVLIAALFITGAAFAESGEPEPSEPPLKKRRQRMKT